MTDLVPASSDAPAQDGLAAKRVLVLQGGGALGAYQAGAFSALSQLNVDPDWVAGISIGAINAALIAGNTRQNRFRRLREFWDRVSSQVTWPAAPWINPATASEWNAGVIMMAGVPGFFQPRFPPLAFQPADDLAKLSFYDTTPLHDTLMEMVDFDLINSENGIRISVGAVDVETGQQHYFDNRKRLSGRPAEVIGPEHIMASAALPPGFPAVKIGKTYYWDGGLTSNTPLDHVLKEKEQDNLLILQLDLFSAKGALPTSLGEIAEREKDIRFASRNAVNAKADRAAYNAGAAPDGAPCDGTVTVIHLIYRSDVPETASRDYNFSPAAVAEHWHSGEVDIERALRHPDWMLPPPNGEPMVEYMLTDADAAPVKRK